MATEQQTSQAKPFSIDFIISHSPPTTPLPTPPSEPKRFSNPLECLAHATLTSESEEESWPEDDVPTIGREQITVVTGPSGPQIRLANGSGPLAHIDVSLLAALKCRNRECNNLCGQADKPRSIYCSKRCQSREQNLRQGRIKNVKRKTTKPPNLAKKALKLKETSSPAEASTLTPTPTTAPSQLTTSV